MRKRTIQEVIIRGAHIKRAIQECIIRGAHVKYWRPQFMLVLHGGPCDNVPALEFVDNLKKGGLFVIGDTITVPEQGPDRGTFQECHERRSLWHSFLEEVKLNFLAKT